MDIKINVLIHTDQIKYIHTFEISSLLFNLQLHIFATTRVREKRAHIEEDTSEKEKKELDMVYGKNAFVRIIKKIFTVNKEKMEQEGKKKCLALTQVVHSRIYYQNKYVYFLVDVVIYVRLLWTHGLSIKNFF